MNTPNRTDNVGGPGSNQYAKKPPVTTTSPAAETAVGKAAGAAADPDPFAPPAANPTWSGLADEFGLTDTERDEWADFTGSDDPGAAREWLADGFRSVAIVRRWDEEGWWPGAPAEYQAIIDPTLNDPALVDAAISYANTTAFTDQQTGEIDRDGIKAWHAAGFDDANEATGWRDLVGNDPEWAAAMKQRHLTPQSAKTKIREYDGTVYGPAKTFTVNAEGAYLTGFKPAGAGSFEGWRKDLQPGDTIVCEGYGPGFGGDPGYGIHWDSDGEAFAVCLHPQQGGAFNYRPQTGAVS